MKLFETMMRNVELGMRKCKAFDAVNRSNVKRCFPTFRMLHPAFLIVLMIPFLASCNDDDFDKRTVIPEAEWHQENRVAFDVDINDTASIYEFGIGLRHLENYRYSNLFVFLHTAMPNGNVTHDTIECTLATPEGKWIGKSSGSMRDLTLPLNENLKFPLLGTYHFEIEQAMREPVLKGISDIGIYIEKQ